MLHSNNILINKETNLRELNYECFVGNKTGCRYCVTKQSSTNGDFFSADLHLAVGVKEQTYFVSLLDADGALLVHVGEHERDV